MSLGGIIPGKENMVMDVLSKRKWINAISIIRGSLIEKIKRMNDTFLL